MGTVSLVLEWLRGPGCGALKGMNWGAVIRPVSACLDRPNRSLGSLLEVMGFREPDTSHIRWRHEEPQ